MGKVIPIAVKDGNILFLNSILGWRIGALAPSIEA
jgi:hypothetical protein